MENNPLLDLMSQQIAARREAILREAQSEAARIEQDARKRAEERRAATIASVEGELASLAARSRERAEAEAQMVALTTKDSITNEVLKSVEGALAERAVGTDFPAVLDALLAELMAESRPDIVVLAPEAHVDHCRQWLESHGHPDLAVQALPGLTDGVAIQDRAGKFRYTNTLSARFRLQEGALRKRALNQLFPDSGAGGEG